MGLTEHTRRGTVSSWRAVVYPGPGLRPIPAAITFEQTQGAGGLITAHVYRLDRLSCFLEVDPGLRIVRGEGDVAPLLGCLLPKLARNRLATVLPDAAPTNAPEELLDTVRAIAPSCPLACSPLPPRSPRPHAGVGPRVSWGAGQESQLRSMGLAWTLTNEPMAPGAVVGGRCWVSPRVVSQMGAAAGGGLAGRRHVVGPKRELVAQHADGMRIPVTVETAQKNTGRARTYLVPLPPPTARNPGEGLHVMGCARHAVLGDTPSGDPSVLI